MKPAPAIEPAVRLSGTHVELEPLELAHIPELWKVAEPDWAAIFRWYTHPVNSEQAMREWVQVGLDERDRGTAVPFLIRSKADGAIAGSTRFANIDHAHRRGEIGWTWLATRFQRTAVNTECKYLLLRQAFEVWEFVRVELKTDELNDRSRAAILRLGAKQEGVFRNHMICHDGRLRNSVYFSITREEWPAVKAGLEQKLRR